MVLLLLCQVPLASIFISVSVSVNRWIVRQSPQEIERAESREQWMHIVLGATERPSKTYA